MTWHAELAVAGIATLFPAEIARSTTRTVVTRAAEGQLIAG